MTMGSERGCGGGGSLWRRLSLLRKSTSQTDDPCTPATRYVQGLCRVLDTTTTTRTPRTPRRSAILSYDIHREGECVCKVDRESTSTVGVFYRRIFLRADTLVVHLQLHLKRRTDTLECKTANSAQQATAAQRESSQDHTATHVSVARELSPPAPRCTYLLLLCPC